MLSDIAQAVLIGVLLATGILLLRRSRSSKALILRPEDVGATADGFLIIAQFERSYEADLCREMLQAEGIQCTTLDRPSLGVVRPMSRGGIRIAVRAEDADRAVSLLHGTDGMH